MKRDFSKYFRIVLLSTLAGILAGVSISIFLYSLNWVTQYRNSHRFIILGLPFIGFFIGWLYQNYGKQIARGQNLILEEIHNPKNTVPLRMAPLIYLSTLLTHLFGGSAGREGTAVQMGASLADQLTKIFKVTDLERKILLMAGTGAGFAAAIGTPWAGAIFGMEVIHIGRIKIIGILELFIASFVAYYISIFLKTPHSVFTAIDFLQYNLTTFTYVLIAGCFFGIAARTFIALTHSIEHIFLKLITYNPLKTFIGGLIIVFLYYFLNNFTDGFKYSGLGIDTIQAALKNSSDYKVPLLKMILTSLTVGSGFKGGEFIPLVFIGTSLGNVLSQVLPISLQLLASLGFAAVFAGASNTPIACTLMAIEIFGYQIGPYAFLACMVSYYVSGQKSIYKSQKTDKGKQSAT
jgi:H+/Cl- antiporter ClcA